MLCFNENTFPTSERENAVKYREQHFFYYERKTTDGKSSQWNVGCQFSSSLFKMHTLQTQLENEKSSFHMPMWGYIDSHFTYHMSAVLVRTRSWNEDVRARYLWKPFKIFLMTISLFGKGTFKFISKDHVTIRAFCCGHDVTFCNFNKQGSKSLGNFDHMIIWMNTEFYIVSCTRSATEGMLSYKTAHQNEAADGLWRRITASAGSDDM